MNCTLFSRTILLLCIVFSLLSCNEDSPAPYFVFNFPEDCCNSPFEYETIETGGCKDTSLPFEEQIFKLFVPCVFSPDSEILLNQTQHVYATLYTQVSDLEIYAQDGVLVHKDGDFVTNDYTKGWDGVHDSQILDGPFQINYKLTCDDGSIHSIKGVVCSLLCENQMSRVNSYDEQGLKIDDLMWASQNDGNSGWTGTGIKEECFK